MKIKSGTNRAMELIAHLKAVGKLADIYSDEWYAGRDTKGSLSPSFLQELKDEHGTDFLNHLLIACVMLCDPQEKHELTEVYPPLKNLIGTNKHEPDFLLINLSIQKVLCIGLGRKNRFFAIDAATGKSVQAFPMAYGDNDLKYIEAFTKLDCGDFVLDLCDDLYELGEALADFENTPGNIDTVSQALNAGPEEDGYYSIAGEDDRYTKSEVAGFILKHEQSMEDCNHAMYLINVLFPECESGDFNTQDFW
jgi:hypothetical protein